MNFAKAKTYLEKFAGEADSFFSEEMGFPLEDRYQYFQTFFTKENLEDSEWSDFQEMGKKIHALASIGLAYSRAFGEPLYDIEQCRTTFKYLAFGEDDISDRINNVLDKESPYHLKFLAESFYGELIGYLFPDEYVFYNRRDKEATEFLDLDISRKRGEPFGDFFIRYNEEIDPIVALYEEIVGQHTETTIPLELDQFFSWLYSNHVLRDKETNGVDEDGTGRNYWWLNANPDRWKVESLEIYEMATYTSHNEDGNKRQKYKNFQEVKNGDLIICYETSPTRRVKAILEVTDGLYEDDEGIERFSFRLKQLTPSQPSWDELKSVPDLENCGVLNNNQGSLFRLSEEEFLSIHDLALEGIERQESYTMEDALGEVFMKEEELQNIVDLLEYKKNIILQGPPGTGKTFLAKRLAWLMMETKDPNRVETVQFHPSYSYEDFIRGYRPTEDHFELKNGIFMKMCTLAKSDFDKKPYFLIIDEINRGNLGKIFGELMMLIEKDKRGKDFTVTLPYQKDEDEPDFYIPENLYLIGTMNTADRSLAMVDYALRRRFVFIDMMPRFGPKFQAHLSEQGVDDHLIDTIVDRLKELNETISEEKGLGEGFQVGHSYFSDTEDADEEWYKRVIRYEIMPLLMEYWFDKQKRVEEIKEQLVTL